MAGTSQLAAPITSEGVVLSQPHSSTTASIGLALIDSSTSMLTRLRNIIAEGRMLVSPIDITGNSSGNPPASHTPFFTFCARSRKCALQGVSSDHVLQMPITGRPSNTSPGNPWLRIQLLWMNPSLSLPPNHACDRNFPFSIFSKPALRPFGSLLQCKQRHNGRPHYTTCAGNAGRSDQLATLCAAPGTAKWTTIRHAKPQSHLVGQRLHPTGAY